MNINENLIQNNFTIGREGKNPIEIVIHTNGAPAPNGLFNWFNSFQAQVSAHYQIYLNGQIDRYVKESDTAWHAGIWEENLQSIGIEHEDAGNSNDSVRTDIQYENSAQLIAQIYLRYNWDINNQALIKPHHEFVPTRPCPAGLDINRIRTRVYNILHQSNMDQQIQDLKEQLRIMTYDRDSKNEVITQRDNTIILLNKDIEDLKQKNIELSQNDQIVIKGLQDENNNLNLQIQKLENHPIFLQTIYDQIQKFLSGSK